MTCDRCGRDLAIGMYPFCQGRPDDHARGASAIESVTWPGGKTFENLGHEPQTFYHRTDYDRYLRTHGIEEFVRHQPVPGSDKSPHTTSWSAVTQDTLDGAKAMLERVGKATSERPADYIQSMTVSVSEAVIPTLVPRGTF